MGIDMRQKLTDNGPALSRIIAGVMNWGVWGADLSTADMSSCIDACYDMGVTTFDHADIYGMYTTEETFGDALKIAKSKREDVQLITKCGICLPSKAFPDFTVKSYNTTKEHILLSVENSLRNLGTDYIDLLLIHRPSPIMDPVEIAATFNHLKNQGKVLHFGVSNFTPVQMDMMLRHFPALVTNQVEASVVANDVFLDGTLDHSITHGYSPMAWSPLGGGALFAGEKDKILSTLSDLSQKYNTTADTLCYAFLLHHPCKIYPITGSSKTERIQKAVKAMDIKLSNEDWFVIWEACQGKSIP